MSSYQHILYLEDDQLDVKNMRWLCDQIDGLTLSISDSFQENDISAVDLIITDQYLYGNHFSDFVYLFGKLNYCVLSNNTNINIDKLSHQPIALLDKPLKLNDFKAIISEEKIEVTDKFDLDFFASFTSEEIAEIRKLLLQEFEYFIINIPLLLAQNNTTEMRNIVHKITGKYSMLNMTSTFNQAREIEKQLKCDDIAAEGIHQLVKETKKAFQYLKKVEI